MNNSATAGRVCDRDDNVCDAIPDLDLAELLYEIEDEFGIRIPDDDRKQMDGTFDAIVRYDCLTAAFIVMMWKTNSNFWTER